MAAWLGTAPTARWVGRTSLREEVERRTSEKLRAEALKRADRLLKAAQARRQQEASAAGGGGGGVDFGLESDAAATASRGVESGDVAGVESARGGAVRRRAAVSGRRDNPEVYVEARHAQVRFPGAPVSRREGGEIFCGL